MSTEGLVLDMEALFKGKMLFVVSEETDSPSYRRGSLRDWCHRLTKKNERSLASSIFCPSGFCIWLFGLI